MSDYCFPTSAEQALQILAQYGGQARIIAGGTDVLPDLRKQKIRPQCLVDVTRIPGLDQIEIGPDFAQVGAAVTFSTIRRHPFFQQRVQALVEAAGAVGADGIQNVATWVGNIVQAMPAADGAIVALALEVEARLLDDQGPRWMPVEALFRGPGVSAIDPTRQILTHLRFALPPAPWGTAWMRLGRRPSLVLPVLNCALKLVLTADRQRIQRARIALGPVAPHPFRARQAEAFLLNQPITPEVLAQAAAITQSEANPRSSTMRASRGYRLDVIPALVGDGLSIAAERARKEMSA